MNAETELLIIITSVNDSSVTEDRICHWSSPAVRLSNVELTNVIRGIGSSKRQALNEWVLCDMCFSFVYRLYRTSICFIVVITLLVSCCETERLCVVSNVDIKLSLMYWNILIFLRTLLTFLNITVFQLIYFQFNFTILFIMLFNLSITGYWNNLHLKEVSKNETLWKSALKKKHIWTTFMYVYFIILHFSLAQVLGGPICPDFTVRISYSTENVSCKKKQKKYFLLRCV